MLQTLLLIDGSPDPLAIRIDDRERETYVSQGRAGATARNFKFAKMIGEVAIYRLDGDLKNSLSDAVFEASAQARADEYLHPEKYKDMGKQGALSNSERDELERFRAAAKGK